MGKKKFIDKKKSATFQLLARDSSDPSYGDSPGNDRVFVRVDNNSHADSFFAAGDDDDDPESIFADAPEDLSAGHSSRSHPLPEHVRKEILELGFPDDGYNYLLHLREIKNSGGGSAFYNNPKTKLDQLPSDVKAYDASRLRISEARDDHSDKYMYSVASETVGVRVQRAVDPEVVSLLNDDDLSRFGSDVEDLEEDFIIQANLSTDNEGVSDHKRWNFDENIEPDYVVVDNYSSGKTQIVADLSSPGRVGDHVTEAKNYSAAEKPRERRLLDEQFDLLESKEYGSDDSEDDNYGYMPEADGILAEKLKNALNNNEDDDFELDGKYRAPADLIRADDNPKSAEILESAKDIIQRCVEYAEKYETEQLEEMVVFEESTSDESEVWDCETIVSTYSNLDNHPGKIEVPELARKKKLAKTVSGALSSMNPKISLKGREKMPVDFLTGRNPTAEKVKGVDNLKTGQQNRKPRSEESKEEKKERKAAVKEERREARRMKKETKGLYKGEAQRAQRVAATSGPSSVHIM